MKTFIKQVMFLSVLATLTSVSVFAVDKDKEEAKSSDDKDTKTLSCPTVAGNSTKDYSEATPATLDGKPAATRAGH